MQSITVAGAIEFRFAVTDFEFAQQVYQLLRKNQHCVVQESQGCACHATKQHFRDSATAEKVLESWKAKFGTRQFKRIEAEQISPSGDIVRRALDTGRRTERLTKDAKGVYRFIFFRSDDNTTTGQRIRRIKRPYTITREHLAYLRSLRNTYLFGQSIAYLIRLMTRTTLKH